MQALVPGERAGQEPRFTQNLEAVADTEDGHATLRCLHDLAHDGREPCDGAAPQVVAVGEATGDDDGVDTLEVGVAVPQAHGLAAGEGHRAGGVDVVEGAGESDDSDAGAHASTRLTVQSSITVLASRASAIFSS